MVYVSEDVFRGVAPVVHARVEKEHMKIIFFAKLMDQHRPHLIRIEEPGHLLNSSAAHLTENKLLRSSSKKVAVFPVTS